MALNLYQEFAPKYYGRGYFPFPTFGQTKKPKITNRSEMYGDKYEFMNITNQADVDSNIGIGVGANYGIIALDIDTPEEYFESDIAKKMMNILPSSNFGRVGRQGRILYFFKYKNENNSISIKDKNGETWVELLTNGKFVVVPPSIHPDTKQQYVWVEDNLIDYEVDDLPEMNCDIYKVLDQVKELVNNNIGSNGNEKKSSGGRNDTLKAMIRAAMEKGKGVDEITDEILVYDKMTHSMPLFEDLEENKHRADPYTNAYTFVVSIFNSISKDPKFIIKAPHRFEIVENKEEVIKEEDYKQAKLPKFRGIMQDMFTEIHSKRSIIPRTRYAVAATISTMGTILSNRVHCNNIYSNFYILILGKSGTGKEAPLQYPTDLFSEAKHLDLIGSQPASDSAILRDLELKSSRVDIFKESGRLFRAMGDDKNSYSQAMADIYADLFTSAGSFYSGKALKDKTWGACQSPCISLLCSMTISDFSSSFTSKLIDTGVGARFLFFPDKEVKKIEKLKTDKKISEHIVQFVKDFRSWIPTNNISFSGHKVHDFSMDEKLQKHSLAILNDFRAKGDDDEVLAPIYNRIGENLTKMALLDAISQGQGKVTSDNVEWATEWFNGYAECLRPFLDNNLKSPKILDINDLSKIVLNQIWAAGKKGISKRDILRLKGNPKRGLNSDNFNVILRNLTGSEEIFMEKKGKSLICFHEKFVKQLDF